MCLDIDYQPTEKRNKPPVYVHAWKSLFMHGGFTLNAWNFHAWNETQLLYKVAIRNVFDYVG